MVGERVSALMVGAVLMILAGALNVLGSVGIIGSIGDSVAVGANPGMMWVAVILLLVGSVGEVVVGVMGIMSRSDPPKMSSCIEGGLAVAVALALGAILNAVAGGGFNPVFLATGLIAPIVFLFGASTAKKIP